jgi:hypothetical protein
MCTEIKGCADLKGNEYMGLRYSERSLISFFISINECLGQKYYYYTDNQSRNKFNLNVKAGYEIYSNAVGNSSGSYRTEMNRTVYGNGINLGTEAEFTLGFNRSKWSLAGGINYSYSKGNDSIARVSCSDIEVPVGVRHYFYLWNSSSIFIDFFLGIHFPLTSEVHYYNNYSSFVDPLTLSRNETITNVSIGAGYAFQKFFVTMQYHTARNLLDGYVSWYANQSAVTLSIGRKFF